MKNIATSVVIALALGGSTAAFSECIRGHWEVVVDSADPKDNGRRIWVCDEYRSDKPKPRTPKGGNQG